MFKLFLCKGSAIFDITGYAGNISWGDSIDSLGMEFSFDIGISFDKFFEEINVDCGDIIIFTGKKEIFRGIVINKSFNGINEQSFTCFDFLYYFNKSKIIKQFNKVNAKTAITQLCTELNIKVGAISDMRTLITHIYFNDNVSEVIEDILLQDTMKQVKNL